MRLVITGTYPERPYLFEHRAWFVPYACGFYAAYYGAVTITRDEAIADPARWIALGQPWLYEVPSVSDRG